MTNCETCNNSLPVQKKRFCNENCRQKSYKQKERKAYIDLIIQTGALSQLHTSVATLIKLGYRVEIRLE